jgi:hypothetical protein
LAIGLTGGDAAPDSRHAQGKTLLEGDGGCRALPRLAIADAQAQRQAPIAPHPKAEQPLREIVPPLVAMSVGGVRGHRRRHALGRLLARRCVSRRGAIEGKRGRVLRNPGRRQGIDRQGLERQDTAHPVQVGSKQRLKKLPQALRIECLPSYVGLKERDHPPLRQPRSALVEGLVSIQHRQPQRFYPPGTREHIIGVGGNEGGNEGGDCERTSPAQEQGQMRHRGHRTHCNSHDLPPLAILQRRHPRGSPR